jgi:hypothetical protein
MGSDRRRQTQIKRSQILKPDPEETVTRLIHYHSKLRLGSNHSDSSATVDLYSRQRRTQIICLNSDLKQR